MEGSLAAPIDPLALVQVRSSPSLPSHRPLHGLPARPAAHLASGAQQLVEEKQRALKAAAPHISLQEHLKGGADAAAGPASEPPSVLPTDVSSLARAAVAVAADEGAAWAYHDAQDASPSETGAPQPILSSEVQDALMGWAEDHGALPLAGLSDVHIGAVDPSDGLAAWGGSEEMASNTSGGGGGGGGGPQLHRSSEAAQLRAMRLSQELQLREMEQCTFHPQTNHTRVPAKVAATSFFERSQQWKEDRDRYNEAKRMQVEGKMMQECTFQPAISTPRSGRHSLGSPRGERSGNAQAVVDRLYQPKALVALQQ